MATRKIGPALAAGCTVVLKPAKETPLTAFAVADILREAGVPAGVVNVVCTSKAGPLVSAMLADSRVRKLSFTGSTEVGRVLLATASQTVTNCSMELGGNAPFLIFEDADIDAAIEGAFLAKMRNGGEACTAANRFYVHERVADEFTSRFADRLSKLAVGPGPGGRHRPRPAGQRGHPVEGRQPGRLGDRERRARGHRRARAGPAGLLLPAHRAAATCRRTPAILSTEIFGPVAPVVRFSDEADAIRLANDTEYGLVSYLYTADLRRALRVSEALETGMVGVNRGIVSDPAAPFGGVKQSGLGREGGHDGLLEFTESKYIAVDW